MEKHSIIKNPGTWLHEHPLFTASVRGWMLLLALLFSVIAFAWIGMARFEGVGPFNFAEQMQKLMPGLGAWAIWMLVIADPFSKGQYARYWLLPTGAWLLVFMAGAAYVQDIYDLDSYVSALHYVFSSIFAKFYPRVVIDGGKMDIPRAEQNLVNQIGGPGFAVIQPGSAVIFRSLRQPSRITLPGAYFLRPFETVGAIADLDNQDDTSDGIRAVTLDGIQLHLRDTHFQYRIITSSPSGTPQSRTATNPYPFSETAMQDMAYNGSAGTSWRSTVGRAVVGEIKTFISTHVIDYLTAPRQDRQDPRRELRTRLFATEISRRLRSFGAELLWIDVGHLDILDLSNTKPENVDAQRFAYLASRWAGMIKRTHASGEAKRAAYRQRARVEAQAEMLNAIAGGLDGFGQTGDPAQNVRRILVAGVTQILESMAEDDPTLRGKDHD